MADVCVKSCGEAMFPRTPHSGWLSESEASLVAQECRARRSRPTSTIGPHGCNQGPVARACYIEKRRASVIRDRLVRGTLSSRERRERDAGLPKPSPKAHRVTCRTQQRFSFQPDE